MPKKNGIRDATCHIVGIWPSKSHATNNVNSGAKLLRALALVTDMREMPSSQNTLDRPNIMKPFKTRSRKDSLIGWS